MATLLILAGLVAVALLILGVTAPWFDRAAKEIVDEIRGDE